MFTIFLLTNNYSECNAFVELMQKFWLCDLKVGNHNFKGNALAASEGTSPTCVEVYILSDKNMIQ